MLHEAHRGDHLHRTASDVGFVSNIPTLKITTTGIFRNGFDGQNCLWNWQPDVLGCDK